MGWSVPSGHPCCFRSPRHDVTPVSSSNTRGNSAAVWRASKANCAVKAPGISLRLHFNTALKVPPPIAHDRWPRFPRPRSSKPLLHSWLLAMTPHATDSGNTASLGCLKLETFLGGHGCSSFCAAFFWKLSVLSTGSAKFKEIPSLWRALSPRHRTTEPGQ